MNNFTPIQSPNKPSKVGKTKPVSINSDTELKVLLRAVLVRLSNEEQYNDLQEDNQLAAQEIEDTEGVDFREYIAILLNSKWLIIMLTVLGLLVGKFNAFIAEPVYSTNALVRIEKKKGFAETLQQLEQILEGELPVVDEIEILRSRSLLKQVVENRDMDTIIQPRFYPVIGKAIFRNFGSTRLADAWFGEEEYAWGGESVTVTSFEVPSNLLGKTLTLVAGQPGHYQLLQADGSILLDGQIDQTAIVENQLKLHISDLRARPGTQFNLTKIATRSAVEQLRKRLIVSGQIGSSNILILELTSSNSSEAITTLNELIKIYMQRNVEHMSEEASQTLLFLETQIPKEKARVDKAVEKLNAYRLKQGSVDLTFETQGMLENIITIKEKKQEFESEREDLRERFTPSHPKIKSINAKIRLLDSKISKINTQVGSLPDTQQTILRLTESVEPAKKMYTSLINSAQELRMLKAGTVGNVRVIDYAAPPKLSFVPNKSKAVKKATIFGLILAIALVFLRHLLSRRGIEDPGLIEDRLRIPVYASIPHSDEQVSYEKKQKTVTGKKQLHDYGLLAVNHPKVLTIEGLVSLATRLHFAQKQNSNKTILISGPSPGIGKSFVSANLSVVLANQGGKTLIIDSDLRRGHLHHFFGLPRKNGLSEYLSGDLDLKSTISKTKCPDVYRISTGQLPTNPIGLLMDERLANMFHQLNQIFDHIIIDSPPILAVADASIIARYAGTTLLVAKSGVHTMNELKQCVNKFDHKNINLRGIILNDVKVIEGHGYGRYVYQYDYVKS